MAREWVKVGTEVPRLPLWSDGGSGVNNEVLAATLTALVNKLAAMEAPLNRSLANSAFYGVPYTGPNWVDEITAARAALAEAAK